MSKDAGFVPRWPLADTFVKGVRDWDAAGAYAIAKTQATTPPAAG